METVEFNELQTAGWLNNLFIDYKRTNTNEVLATLKITEHLKCQICGEKKKEIKKLKVSIDETPLLNKKIYNIKNEYILIFNNDMIQTLPTELKNIDRILPLIKVLLENKLNYEITIYSNYLTIILHYRLFNILNKTSLHLLNSKVYECFRLYTSLSTTLNIYKDDIIKQNTFENIRRKLLILDNLGPYNNLKNKLKQPLHNATNLKEKKSNCC